MARCWTRLDATDWLLLCGIVLDLVVGAVPAGIVTHDPGIWCDSDFRLSCRDYLLTSPPWFASDQAHLVMMLGILLAAVVIPFGIGIVARTWLWPPLCAFIAAGSVVVGAEGGEVVAHAWYPLKYDPVRVDDLVVDSMILGMIGLVVAAVPAVSAAVLGTALGRESTRLP